MAWKHLRIAADESGSFLRQLRDKGAVEEAVDFAGPVHFMFFELDLEGCDVVEFRSGDIEQRGVLG